MNEKRCKHRPQNRSSIVFVVDRSAARLSEHDLGRHHESGLLGNGEGIRAESSLSLGLEHYLSSGTLTTCPLAGSCSSSYS